MSRVLLVGSAARAGARGARMIALAGFELATAETVAAALQELRSDPPRAVVCLAESEGIDALALCRRAKSLPEANDAPYFLLADSRDPAFVLRAVEAGVEGFISTHAPAADWKQRLDSAIRRGSWTTDPERAGDGAGLLQREFPGVDWSQPAAAALAAALLEIVRRGRLAQREAAARERAQSELAGTEFRLRSVIESALDCIIVIDEGGRIVEFNRAAQKKFGCRRDDAVGAELVELFVPEDAQARYRRNLAGYMNAGEVGSLLGRRLELPLMTADGDRFLAEIALQPFPMQETSGFAIFLHDITERKRAERKLKRYADELARSNRDLAAFAHAASHDLQEPLRAISAYCRLLEKRSGERLDEKSREFLTYAIESSDRMQSVIDGLLAYSRIDARGKPAERVKVSDVVADAVANLEIAIDESSARVTFDRLPVVSGDRTQFLQLFQNLIGNAIKFRGEKPPRIRVQSQRRSGETVFSVIDNGIGIDAEHAEQVFGIFRRLHSAEEYPGTGLGLALCKRIVERHGGRIWVDSSPGEGSTFSIALPTGGE